MKKMLNFRFQLIKYLIFDKFLKTTFMNIKTNFKI